MAYTFEDEDTQPRPVVDDFPAESGPGCLTSTLVGGVLILFALVIVGLSGAAGWTAGQRESSQNATATQSAAISEQLGRIPADINARNFVLLDTRIRFLATLTPGVPGMQELMSTATAVYLTAQPTATATPGEASTAEAMAEATDEIVITPAGEDGGYDLAGILQQAQVAVDSGQWQDAIDLLDVIIGVDPQFEAGQVRGLMSRALNRYARQLYDSGQAAAANLIVDRATQYGPLDEGLSFERYAAGLYLDARAAAGLGINDPNAMRSLQELLNLGPGRYYEDARQMLYDAYVAAGDAEAGRGEYCPAVVQYQNAINIIGSGPAVSKRDNARDICAQATPTPDPLAPQAAPLTPGGSPIAPIGQPGA